MYFSWRGLGLFEKVAPAKKNPDWLIFCKVSLEAFPLKLITSIAGNYYIQHCPLVNIGCTSWFCLLVTVKWPPQVSSSPRLTLRGSSCPQRFRLPTFLLKELLALRPGAGSLCGRSEKAASFPRSGTAALPSPTPTPGGPAPERCLPEGRCRPRARPLPPPARSEAGLDAARLPQGWSHDPGGEGRGGKRQGQGARARARAARCQAAHRPRRRARVPAGGESGLGEGRG